MHEWANRQGGLDVGSPQQRAECAARAIAGDCTGHSIIVHVLANDAAAAFSWPSGHVFVTRGLVQKLDDAELAAAMAHELGHMLSDGHLRSVVSLSGSSTNMDREERADAFGVELLRAQHLRPSTMISMLQKVRDGASLPALTRAAIDHRIRLLNEFASPGRGESVGEARHSPVR